MSENHQTDGSMTERVPISRRVWFLGLAFLLGLHLLMFLFAGPYFEASDDMAYTANAYHWSIGTFKLTPHVFDNRFTVFVPIAYFFKWFGFGLSAVVLWPLICSLSLITLLYAFATRLFGWKSAIVAATLLAANPLQIEHVLTVNNDVILSFFIVASLTTVYFGRMLTTPLHQFLAGALFVILFTCGFLAKMSMVWFIPMIVFLMGRDWLKQTRNRPFWLTVALLGAMSAFLHFYLYYLFTGDFLYPIHGVEKMLDATTFGAGSPMAREYGKFIGDGAMLAYLKRLTYEPVVLFLESPGASLVLLLALPVILQSLFSASSWPRPTRYWVAGLGLFLIGFWFGSISLKHYLPLSLTYRYLVPMLPFLSLLGGLLLVQWIEPSQESAPASRFALWSTVLLLLAGIGASQWLRLFKFQHITLLMVLVTLWTARRVLPEAWLGTRKFAALSWGLLLVTIVLIPLRLIQSGMLGQSEDQRLEMTLWHRHLEGQQPGIRIYTDYRSSKALPVMLGFPDKNRLTFIDWRIETPPDGHSDLGDGKIYVYVNRKRLQGLTNSYRYQPPSFVQNPPAWWTQVAAGHGITLYEIRNALSGKPK
ncbi:MAG: glycosyltransferase family 39 protein [Magnetococcales bacterium]|nr:glycosyltransferase family 39 protein [Magnetococcales bacterium]MBF0440185.1 glycosyltransferase family 39 protein [Magnetococcales bacterium]